MPMREGQTGTAPDGTRVVVRGGQIVPVGQPAGPKPRPDWGDGARELPDGSIVRYGARGGMSTLQGPTKATAAPPDIKEFQANAAARATLMDQGQRDYNAARQEGYDPGSPKNVFARSIEGSGIGNWAADVVRDNPSERARAAELQFVDGALRTTSGANAPEPEVVRANKQYFRQPGESEGVEPNRQELRQRFRDQAVRIAGPAYTAPPAKPMPVPKPARTVYEAGVSSGRFDTKAKIGTEARPYVARDMATANRLPKGSFVILPNGAMGVVE